MTYKDRLDKCIKNFSDSDYNEKFELKITVTKPVKEFLENLSGVINCGHCTTVSIDPESSKDSFEKDYKVPQSYTLDGDGADRLVIND